MTVVFGGDEVLPTFEDNGVPFDPSRHPGPAVPESLEEASLGGLTTQRRNTLLVAIPTL